MRFIPLPLYVLFFLLSFSSASFAEHKAPISFYAPSFFKNSQVIDRILHPVVDFLEDTLNKDIHFRVNNSYESFMFKALKAEPDIILAPYFVAKKLNAFYAPIWQTSPHTVYIYAKEKIEASQIKSALHKQTILAPSRYAHIALIAQRALSKRYGFKESEDYYILGTGGYDTAFEKLLTPKYNFAVLTDTTAGFLKPSRFDDLVPITQLGVSPGSLILVKRELLFTHLKPLLNNCQFDVADAWYQAFKAQSGLELSCVSKP